MIRNNSNTFYRLFLFIIISICLTGLGYSQLTDFDTLFPEIVLSHSNDPAPGYFFIATKKTYVNTAKNYIAIIDNYGTPVYFRLADGKAAGLQVREDGIYLNEGDPKKYYRIDSMLTKADTFTTQGYKLDGHDFDIDSNGHMLLLGNDLQTVDLTSLGGVVDATVKDKVVQEFNENGNLLYTWKALDHFEITDANENSPFVDYTASTVDYIHANSIAFDSDTSFLLSCRHFDEITKIDRRTGDIIWRLGGKHNQFTFLDDTLKFSHPHTVRKMENGDILIFDNGNLHDPRHSSTVEYLLDEQAMTATMVRRQYHEPDIFVNHSGGQMMLPNDNLLVYWGEVFPSFTEYHPDGSVAIEMDYSAHSFSNRVAKSTWKHEVFETGTDTIQYSMWDGYTESNYLLNLHNNTDSIFKITGYSTRTDNFYIQEQFPVEIPPLGDKTLLVTYFPQNATSGYIKDVLTIQANYPRVMLAQQVVLLGRKEDNQAPEVQITPDTVHVPINAVINVDFSEPVRNLDGTALNYENVDGLFVLKKDNAEGIDVPFNANVSTDKTHIYLVTLDSLLTDQTYFVFLDALLEDYSGNGITPTSVKFSTGSIISGLPERKWSDFKIYPNPGTGRFSLEFNKPTPKNILIYSVTGDIVYVDQNIKAVHYQFDLSEQAPGIYLIRISSPDGRLHGLKKLILLR